MYFCQRQGRPWRALLPLLCLGTSMVAALADTHAATAASAAVAAANASSPTLTCQVTYAGTTHTVVARPVADPYPVPSVDIAGRFRFKAVMVGDAERPVQRVALCTGGAQSYFEAAIAAGATAVIQPGGSMRDDEVIAAADAHGVAIELATPV